MVWFAAALLLKLCYTSRGRECAHKLLSTAIRKKKKKKKKKKKRVPVPFPGR